MTESKSEPKLGVSHFTDSTGVVWVLRLNVGMIDDIKEQCDLDLIAMLQNPKEFATVLVMDPRKLGMIFWIMCQEQAEKEGVEPKEFGRRLDRDTIDSATDALIAAIVGFYPRGSQGRLLLEKLPQVLATMDKTIADRTSKLLENSSSTRTS